MPASPEGLSSTHWEQIVNASKPLIAFVLFSAAALLPLDAAAQAHQVKIGRYTLRSSTVASETIPASMAKAHGFTRSPSLAILNVTVSERGRPGNGTVAADLAVRIRDLVGREVPVDMTQDRTNGYVSYYGTYHRAPRRTYVFDITATPQDGGPTLTLRYHDR